MVSVSEFVSEEKYLFDSAANGYMSKYFFVPVGSEKEGLKELLVQKGEEVAEGQVIAKGRFENVHSPVPGIVSDIFVGDYGDGKQGLIIKIMLSGAFSITGKKHEKIDWKIYDSTSLAFMLRDAGIQNTFKKPVPIYEQIKEISEKENKILVIRLFDEDPARCIDSFVTRKFSQKIYSGAAILAKAIEATAVVFAYEKAFKPDESVLGEYFESDAKLFFVPIDVKKYPFGTMHDLVSSIKKHKSCRNPIFEKLGAKDFFVDSVTLAAIYDAIVFEKPMIDRYIHVNGACLNVTGIIKLKIGTMISSVVDQFGGFKEPPARIVINGIVTGLAVNGLNVPISKNVKSITFLPQEQVPPQHSEICIRCGRCRKICPVNLWPGNIYRAARSENDEPDVLKISLLCSECGLCNAVCPSRIPLCQTIALVKEKIKE